VKKHDGDAPPESCPMSVIVMPLSWLPREKPPPQRSALRRVSKDEAVSTEDAGIQTVRDGAAAKFTQAAHYLRRLLTHQDAGVACARRCCGSLGAVQHFGCLADALLSSRRNHHYAVQQEIQPVGFVPPTALVLERPNVDMWAVIPLGNIDAHLDVVKLNPTACGSSSVRIRVRECCAKSIRQSPLPALVELSQKDTRTSRS
jgi:hypothetical protein